MKKQALGCLLLVGGVSCATDDPTEPALGSTESAVAVQPTAKFLRAPGAIANSYIVVMKAATGVRAAAAAEASVTRLATTHNAAIEHRFTSAIQGFAATMSEADAIALADDPEVAFVEEDHLVYSTAGLQQGATWGIDRIDQTSLPLDTKYKYLATGANVTAYVIDTGIRPTHAEFTGRTAAGFTSIADGNGTNDCNEHGTHVSGTVAGSVLGVAKNTTVVPVRVLDCTGSGPVSGVIAGIDYVTANRRLPAVVNMSLGGPASDAQDVAIRNLVAAGVTVVVAAGNENQNACNVSPARVPEAITVGATGKTDARAPFSNYGTCVDVFAPGVDISAAGFGTNTEVRVLSGTSMASPHVAGAVALYLSANPTAKPAQVAQALLSKATPGKVTDPVGSPNLLLNTMFVDTTAPTAQITSPANGATVADSFQLAASISDPNLEKVQLMIDGQVADTRTEGPYSFQVSALARGTHTLMISATDAAGQSATSSVQVTVSGAAGPNGSTGNSTPDPVGSLEGGCSTGAGAGLWAFAALAGLLARRRRR